MPHQPIFPSSDDEQREWAMQFDMRERGRRLSALRKATEGKVLSEVKPGLWEYVPLADAKPRRRRVDSWGVPV